MYLKILKTGPHWGIYQDWILGERSDVKAIFTFTAYTSNCMDCTQWEYMYALHCHLKNNFRDTNEKKKQKEHGLQSQIVLGFILTLFLISSYIWIS